MADWCEIALFGSEEVAGVYCDAGVLRAVPGAWVVYFLHGIGIKCLFTRMEPLIAQSGGAMETLGWCKFLSRRIEIYRVPLRDCCPVQSFALRSASSPVRLLCFNLTIKQASQVT